MKRIDLVDLAATDREVGPDIRRALERTAASGQFVLGAEVASFEAALAEHAGKRCAVGVGSGSDALFLALVASGVGPGDVVATTPLSFVATAEAIARTGARPCFVDVAPDTLCLSPAALAACLSARPIRAVVPVQLYGRACAPEIATLAADAGCALVNDAAQAFGADVPGVMCLSFHPSKTLGAWGDGGAVLTDDAALAERVRSLRVHGRGPDGLFREVGLNSRLDALQAAVLAAKLPHVPRWLARRRANAARFRDKLRDIPEVTLLAPFHERDACHLFTVRVRDRDAVLSQLHDAGIGARAYYPRLLCDEPAFAGAASADPLPIARRACGEVLSLPTTEHLDDDDIDRVADALVAAIRPR